MKLHELMEKAKKLIEDGYGNYEVVNVDTGYLLPINDLVPETKPRCYGRLPPREIIIPTT